MTDKTKTKQLFKILMGAAWIDGIIQVEEREYLNRMATQAGIADDPEIQPLLSEIKQVNASECYRWLEAYLGENHTEADYQELLESLSALIYSDGEVDTREAQLLVKIQSLDPALDAPKSPFDRVLKSVQTLYRKAIDDRG